jgi:O-antigen ligase
VPWSTSATSILVVLWALVLLPTLDLNAIKRELRTAAGGIPIAFAAFAVLGMLWAHVSFREQLGGLSAFHRFLAIPLLMAQFRRSGNGWWVLLGFLGSCGLLLVVSYIHAIMKFWTHAPAWELPGLPVKDYIAQSMEFQICAFVLAYAGLEAWRARRVALSVILLVLAAAFLGNIVYLVTGRTTLAAMPVLLALLVSRFSRKAMLVAVLVAIVLSSFFWVSSPYLRARMGAIGQETSQYWTENANTSAGQRLELWKKSMDFVAAAPFFGHGTGSIRQLYQNVVGVSGPSTIVTNNPQQQILTVAVQLGLIGVALLFAMWSAHLALFCRRSMIAWAGLIVVAQNMTTSLFNSHLFDFTQAWLYVFSVGVFGGTLNNYAVHRAWYQMSPKMSARLRLLKIS